MPPVVVAEPVRAALADGRPVVALESTLIAHGLPAPRNLAVACELEELLAGRGVVAATVAVLAGVPVVGVDAGQLERIAVGTNVAKVSVRELPLVAAAGRDAATTVASTAFLARAAGVQVIATGGLGGVHRDAARTFDESADLTALARLPVTVVCAGVKSILDVGATLERLETLGVPVLGYRTRRFPGFYVADSGYDLEWSAAGPDDVVDAMRAARALGMTAALVVANPVPVADQLDPQLHEAALVKALTAADRAAVRGTAVTPFLLEQLRQATGGASLEANIAAVKGNVVVAAEIARCFAGR